MNEVRIRPEAPEDREAIFAVHLAAFGQEPEARLVDLLRQIPGYGPSLVAEVEGSVVGHVLFSRAEIDCLDGERREVSNLAPVGVLPDHQRKGIGGRLIEAALAEIEIPVIVLGHEDYYPRFGFEPAVAHGIEWPYSDEPTPPEFMVWVPSGDWSAYRGRAIYPEPFDQI